MEAEIVLGGGGLYRKGGTPKKGGTLASSQKMPVRRLFVLYASLPMKKTYYASLRFIEGICSVGQAHPGLEKTILSDVFHLIDLLLHLTEPLSEKIDKTSINTVIIQKIV